MKGATEKHIADLYAETTRIATNRAYMALNNGASKVVIEKREIGTPYRVHAWWPAPDNSPAST